MKKSVFGLLIALGGCTQITHEHYEGDTIYVVADDTDATGETNAPIVSPIVPNTDVAEFNFNLFETPGLVLWLDATPETVEAMNEDWGGGWFLGDVYDVNEAATNPLLLNHLYAQLPDGRSTDYGQVGARLAGQSSGYPWSPDSIPNFNLKLDEVTEQKLGGFSRLRLNNGQVGSMLGESSALAIYRAIGYPTPQTTFVLVGGSGWGNAETLIPYIAVERYKKDFCTGDRAETFGGSCVNIWEAYGADISIEMVSAFTQQCEISSDCDETRLNEFAEVVSANMGSQEFEEATEPYLDWSAYRTFQCMEWLLAIGDDALHNSNNILLTEGEDGKFRFHPYSTDISAGVAWNGAFSNVDLYGSNAPSMGCQYDISCWEATLSRCSELIDELEALSIGTTVIDPLRDTLESIEYPWGEDGGDGAWRAPDEARYEILKSFYATRFERARDELANYPAWVTGGDTGIYDTDALDTNTPE